MKRIVAAIAMALPVSGPVWGQEPINFVFDTAQDLVTVCGVPPSDPNYTAAIHFCRGYGHGAIQYYLVQALADPAEQFLCFPDPPPTREEGWAQFMAWLDAHPEYLENEAVDVLFRFLGETFPCP